MKACKAGDKRSCWRTAVIKPGINGKKIAHEGMVRAGRNCLAGDLPSCNALVYHRDDLILLPESYDAAIGAATEIGRRAEQTAIARAMCHPDKYVRRDADEVRGAIAAIRAGAR